MFDQQQERPLRRLKGIEVFHGGDEFPLRLIARNTPCGQRRRRAIPPQQRRLLAMNPQLVEHDSAYGSVHGPAALNVEVIFGAPFTLQLMSMSR